MYVLRMQFDIFTSNNRNGINKIHFTYRFSLSNNIKKEILYLQFMSLVHIRPQKNLSYLITLKMKFPHHLIYCKNKIEIYVYGN